MAEQTRSTSGTQRRDGGHVLAMIGVGPFVTIRCCCGRWVGRRRCSAGSSALSSHWRTASCGPNSGPRCRDRAAAINTCSTCGSRGAGRLFSFLFLWQTVAGMPLVMASGATGFALRRLLFPTMTAWQSKALAMAGCARDGRDLPAYRSDRPLERGARHPDAWRGRMDRRRRRDAWVVADDHLSAGRVATFTGFWLRVGRRDAVRRLRLHGLQHDLWHRRKVVRPERTIPRSILVAIVLVCTLYVTMNLSIISVMPWRDAFASTFIASDFIARVHVASLASVMTALILVIALSSLSPTC